MAPAVLLRLEIERLEARLGGIGAVARSVAGGSVPSALPA
jgi:hypothetical protein